jgi:MFS transporter, UMF1 family
MMSENSEGPTVDAPPAAANTDALPEIGALFQESGGEDRVIPRKQVASWALWDWSTQPFNSVLLTFVFAPLFLTSSHFLPESIASLPDTDPQKVSALADLTSGYGLATTIAGLLILLLAPVLGQQADRAGKKKRWLFIFTMLLVLLQFALFFTLADPIFFWYGAITLAVGAVVSEIAGVNYNAMLVQVSTPKTIGRVSGLGWGLGYFGGIVALGIIVGLETTGVIDLSASGDGLGFRLIALGCGIWTIVFSIPIFLNIPEQPAYGKAERVGFFRSYAVLVQDIVRLFHTHRSTFWFLLASAVYRDGLAGVFAFGGVLAAVAFGFSPTEVIIFGIAGNVVAGISTISAGRADDRFGARTVIVFSLVGLLVVSLFVFFGYSGGQLVFWIGGLILASFVGPAQASSRSLLARVTPAGMQGEIFGLYATTGRVASFISPAMWTLFITIFGATIWGVLGIALVILAGLLLLLFVRLPKQQKA